MGEIYSITVRGICQEIFENNYFLFLGGCKPANNVTKIRGVVYLLQWEKVSSECETDEVFGNKVTLLLCGRPMVAPTRAFRIFL